MDTDIGTQLLQKINPDYVTKRSDLPLLVASLEIDKIVIFIDELVRFPEHAIFDILECISPSSNANHFVCVLEVDQNRLLQLIRKYKPELDKNEYMNKIFQLSISLPKLDDVFYLTEILNTKSSQEKVFNNKISDIILVDNRDLITRAVELEPQRLNNFINDF